jgi:type IV pilus assembly protein PilA
MASHLIQKGFTLIELMIVVAIIGAIAAAAIPSFLDYIARSQASEGLTLTSAIKAPLTEYYLNNARVPSLADLGSAQSTGKYVEEITIIETSTNIIVQATFKSANVSINILNGTFAIATDTSLTSWTCGDAGAISSAYTSIDSNYMPNACR